MSDAFSRLPIKAIIKASKSSLDINAENSEIDLVYTQHTTLMKMTSKFRKKLIENYKTKPT